MIIYEADYLKKNVLNSTDEKLTEVMGNKEAAYEYFEIPKKHGRREIYGLTKDDYGKELKKLQKNLCHNFLDKCPLPNPAKGFRKGENYQTFLWPHIGMRYFLKIDIKSFFDSFSKEILQESLQEYIRDPRALKIVIGLCTIDEKMPQGAASSPALSNIAFARIDQRILKYCQTIASGNIERLHRRKSIQRVSNINYSRYADDMIFSSDFLNFENNRYFLRMISKILNEYGFEINRKKTVMSKEKLIMNGYVISDCICLSRNKTKSIKRILYYFRDKTSDISSAYKIDKMIFDDQNGIKRMLNDVSRLHIWDDEERYFSSLQELIYYLGGCRSWLISLLQINNVSNKKVRNMQKLVDKIEMLMDELSDLEE